MTELVTHKVKVSTFGGRDSKQTDHLVKSHTACYRHILITAHHVPVHSSIDKTENDCLITHKSLIMTFGIRDCLLFCTAVCQFPEHIGYVPVFIFLLFKKFDPVIRNTHSHTIVETYTSVFERKCKTRHTAHLLCDSYC